jgi:hypothetical protein
MAAPSAIIAAAAVGRPLVHSVSVPSSASTSSSAIGGGGGGGVSVSGHVVLDPLTNPLLASRLHQPQRPPPLTSILTMPRRPPVAAVSAMLSPSSFLKSPSPPAGSGSPRDRIGDPATPLPATPLTTLNKPSSPLATLTESRFASLLTALTPSATVSSLPASAIGGANGMSSSVAASTSTSTTTTSTTNGSGSSHMNGGNGLGGIGGTHFTLTPITIPGSSSASSTFSMPPFSPSLFSNLSPLPSLESSSFSSAPSSSSATNTTSSLPAPARPMPIKLPVTLKRESSLGEPVLFRKLPSVPEWADGSSTPSQWGGTSKDSGNTTPGGTSLAGVPSFRRIESFVGKEEGFSLFTGSALGVPEVASPRSPMALQYDLNHHAELHQQLNKPNSSPKTSSIFAEYGSSLLVNLPEPVTKLPPVRRAVVPTAAATTTITAPQSAAAIAAAAVQHAQSTAAAAAAKNNVASNAPQIPGAVTLPAKKVVTNEHELLLNFALSPGGTIVDPRLLQPQRKVPALSTPASTTTAASSDRIIASGGKVRAMAAAPVALPPNAHHGLVIPPPPSSASLSKRKPEPAVATTAPKRRKTSKRDDDDDDDDLNNDADAAYQPPSMASSVSSTRPKREAAAAAQAAIRKREREQYGDDDDNNGNGSDDDNRSVGASSVGSASAPILGPNGEIKKPVVAYTKEERAARIARFREKKARWTYQKRIIYACRKTFADSRYCCPLIYHMLLLLPVLML